MPPWTLSAQVVLVAPVAAADRDVYILSTEHQSGSLDRLADALDPLGRARYLVPTMALAYVTARLARSKHWSAAVVRIAVGYTATDIMGSVLKPTVGRHRPDSSRRPWRFRPFNAKSEWHSFPSAHTWHAFALATGIAEEADNRWVSIGAYVVASGVGLQRVYTGSHWLSDVAGSAALAIGVSKSANRRLRRHQRDRVSSEGGIRVSAYPGTIAVHLSFPR